MKKCSHCKDILPISCFGKRKSNADGLDFQCRNCKKKQSKKSYRTNKPKRNAESKATYKLNSKNPDYNKKRAVQGRNSYLIKNYNITEKQYESLLKRQGGVCGICKKKSDKNFHVDHDHSTGKIRGLLCLNCNHALGFFKDSQSILESAFLYLEYKGANNICGCCGDTVVFTKAESALISIKKIKISNNEQEEYDYILCGKCNNKILSEFNKPDFVDATIEPTESLIEELSYETQYDPLFGDDEEVQPLYPIVPKKKEDLN